MRSLREHLEGNKQQIERALPQQISSERFVRSVLTLLRGSAEMQECTAQSFLGAVLTCAQLGLEPGPLGLAYLLPFYNRKKGLRELQVIIGYRGYIELAQRSGKLASIEAREVCEGDQFDFAYGLNPKLDHWWNLRGERGESYAYYGIARFANGGEFFLVMSRAEVDRFRARGKASDGGAWSTDYDAMARKTVIRRMEPYLPKSTELALAFASDGHTVNAVGDVQVIAEADDESDIQDAQLVETPRDAAGSSESPLSEQQSAPEPPDDSAPADDGEEPESSAETAQQVDERVSAQAAYEGTLSAAPDDEVDAALQIVSGYSVADVTRRLRDFDQSTQGGDQVRRMRLLPFIAEEVKRSRS